MTSSQQISDYLNSQMPEMIRLLNDLVVIQSGSKNKPGIDKVGAVIQKEMEAIGFNCRIQEETDHGNHLIARSPNYRPDQKQILITGHMDTVFPHDTAFNFFKTDNDHCYGPGVADMKGGLVVGMFALKALIHTTGLPELPVTFIFNSDEEIGSPTSKKLIRNEAKKSKIGFVLEAGGLNHEIVTGRKGNLTVKLNIKGEAGHAAFAGKDKASAILELAHKTIAIEALNQPEKGISANVGTVHGGIGPNTVPEHAAARLDFRFLETEDFESLKYHIAKICNTSTNPRTQTEFKIVTSRSAMPETKANMETFHTIKQLADSIDIPVISELRQGVSDANIISSEGTPVIDGLGPIGAKDHSEDEYILTRSILDRTILFSHILDHFGRQVR